MVPVQNPPHSTSDMRTTAFIVGLFLIGLYLRLESMTTSLWLDEFGTFWVAQSGLREAIERSWSFQGQSPFYYLLPWASLQILGESEAALRLPSLVVSVTMCAIVYVCGRDTGGKMTGIGAAMLAWLLASNVRAGIEARPYGLVLLVVAIALAGFQRAAMTGRPWPRVVWIVGGAAVAWAHYVAYPVVVGCMLAYVFVPELRARYVPRRFAVDVLAQVALVALCVPQIAALADRRAGLSWIDTWNYLAFLSPLGPLVPAVVIGMATPLGRAHAHLAAWRTAVLWALVAAIGSVLGAALIGINLLDARYFVASIVPALLLASLEMGRLPAKERRFAFAAFLLISGVSLVATQRASGSFSGLGNEDWRLAVTRLRIEHDQRPHDPVFIRTGFVEEELASEGRLSEATLSPLRSPGMMSRPIAVTPLTFRWSNPRRADYFEHAIAPRIAGAESFMLMGLDSLAGQPSYLGEFDRWVEVRWPRTFKRESLSFGAVSLVRFQRGAP